MERCAFFVWNGDRIVEVEGLRQRAATAQVKLFLPPKDTVCLAHFFIVFADTVLGPTHAVSTLRNAERSQASLMFANQNDAVQLAYFTYTTKNELYKCVGLKRPGPT